MNSKLQIKLTAVPCDLTNLCCPDQITTYEWMLHYIKYIKELYIYIVTKKYIMYSNPPQNLVPCM